MANTNQDRIYCTSFNQQPNFLKGKKKGKSGMEAYVQNVPRITQGAERQH